MNRRIDFTNDQTIVNFITDIEGFECATKFSQKLIGCFFFLGMMLSIYIWIKCTDYFGRKNIIILGSIIQLLAFTGVCFDDHS